MTITTQLVRDMEEVWDIVYPTLPPNFTMMDVMQAGRGQFNPMWVKHKIDSLTPAELKKNIEPGEKM